MEEFKEGRIPLRSFSTSKRIRNDGSSVERAMREKKLLVTERIEIKKALADSTFPRNDFHCALATMTYALVGRTASILHDSYFRPYLNKAESGPVPARCNARQRIAAAIGRRLIPLCPRYFRLVYDLIRDFVFTREKSREGEISNESRNCVRIGESYRVLFPRGYTYVCRHRWSRQCRW